MIVKLFLTEDLAGSFMAGFNKETGVLEKRIPMKLAWTGATEDPKGLDLGKKDYTDTRFDLEAEVFDILSEIFRRFNIEHPSDYKNRSLSVGDMVSLGGHNYLCQPLGWKYLGLMTLPDEFALGE